jgi:diketogulonate reductase-like aldo/keto reductase
MANDQTTGRPVIEVQGVEVPALGFGTWQMTGNDAREGVRDALEIGYRQIDTARAYGNEAEVARGIADSGVAREQLFITTKVPPRDAAPGAFRASAEKSLRDLDTDYVDLLLLHWPNPDVPVAATLEAMQGLQADGLIRHFGVSNFSGEQLREALSIAPVLCDQVEYHPFLTQREVLRVAEEHDVLVTAYSPLAQGAVADDATLRRIGEAHGKSPGQVALRWLLEQPRVSPIPKASSHERRAENFDILDFELSDAERDEIAGLAREERDG